MPWQFLRCRTRGEEPFVYITKDESGALCFSTKGELPKTLVPCKIKGKYARITLNAKILRQVAGNYDREESFVLFSGSAQEVVIITDKEDSENFNIISQVDA